jgi:hypothetical protein
MLLPLHLHKIVFLRVLHLELVLVEGSEEHSYYRLASIHDDRMIIHA